MHPRNCNPSKRNRTSTQPAVGDLLPEVRMSVEEYLRLVERTADNVERVSKAAKKIERSTRKARRAGGKAAKGMAKAIAKDMVMKCQPTGVKPDETFDFRASA